MSKNKTLSVAIMTHPKRMELNKAEEIIWMMTRDCSAENANCGELNVRVNVDEDSLGCWWNARECWLLYDPECMYHMVVPDDISTCRYFHKAATDALNALTQHKGLQPASFFNARGITETARDRGHSWSMTDEGVWGQSMILPTAWIPHFIDWCDNYFNPRVGMDDTRFNVWLMLNERQSYCTSPSIIEYAGYMESIMGHSGHMFGRPKTAYIYIGDEGDPRDIDWHAGLRWGDDIISEFQKNRSQHVYERWGQYS